MSKKLIIGAICVLLGTFIGGLAIFLLTGRETAAPQSQTVPTIAPPTNASFADLRESDIPGRYMIYGNEEYSMTLYADHTFKRLDGAINPNQGWYLTPEALVINWGGNVHRYDRIEGPGIYSCPKSIGGRRTMEKQPANPGDLIKPPPRP